MKKTLTLAAAVSLALSAHGAQASVSYNAVDLDFDIAQDYGGWSWSNGDPGYTGNLAVTWSALIQNTDGIATSDTVNSAGAGYTIGVGARSYKDSATNWAHNSDFGLFRLEHDANVTITMTSDGSDLRSAFGLWRGWATGGSRHAPYLDNGAINPMGNNPLGPGLTVVNPNAWAVANHQGVAESAVLSLFLSAGDYTLILGGYDGTTPGQHLAYSLNITASPVPIPGAAWLFAGGLATLITKRRTRKIN